MSANLNFSISSKSRRLPSDWDLGPFKNLRCLDLSAKILSSSEKLWLGQQIFMKKHTTRNLADLFNLKINTLGKYARDVQKGITPRENGGRPPILDQAALDDVESKLTRKSKSENAQTESETKFLINKGALATKKRSGLASFGHEVSETTTWRVLKKLKVRTTTKAETSTVARRREEADIRNMVTEAAIMEAFMKDLDPMVILNEDATTYKMGKDGLHTRVYFVKGARDDDLGPLRRETNANDSLGLYIKCINIISAGDSCCFVVFTMVPQVGTLVRKSTSLTTLRCPAMVPFGVPRFRVCLRPLSSSDLLGLLASSAGASRALSSSAGSCARWFCRSWTSVGQLVPYLTRPSSILSMVRRKS